MRIINRETREQGERRREINPVQWTEHTIGANPIYESKNWTVLGPDYEVVMAEIIETQMQLHHDASTANRQNILEFLEVEPQLRGNYWRQIRQAEVKLKKYRREHDMRSFTWALEYRETVLSILGLNAGKARTANTIEQKQTQIVRKAIAQQKRGESQKDALETGDLAMFHRTNKIKPEYQGDNHPLQKNQVTRDPNPRPVPHSKKAIKALEEFEARTGKNAFICYPNKVTPIKGNPK